LRNFLISAGAASSVLAAIAFVPTIAFGEETVTPLLKQAINGTAQMEANVAQIDISPGHATERHVHPGHVFIYVLEGSIEIDVDGEEPLKASAGQAIYELPDRPMVGRNASSSEGARIIVFQVGEAGKPLEVPQPQ
jgi:quercetin dioxygenase-like cupin family protein